LAGLFRLARELWHAMTPESREAEPVVTVLDDERVEFAWRGPALIVDRKRRVLLRGGRMFMALGKIRSIDVIHQRADEDDPEQWKVCLGLGFFSGESLGTTTVDVEASIAAARLATLLDVPVRSL
jgi:hypothetical protein